MKNSNLLSEIFERIKSYIEDNSDNGKPIINYKTPYELQEIIDFPISNTGISEENLLGLVDKYLEHSVRTGNKQFFNQLYSGYNSPAFIGEVCARLTNTSIYTYEVAPVASLIESEMIRLMNSYAGYKNGDGTFVTGGSNANLIAMFTARNKMLPMTPVDGYDRNIQLTVFINEYAHYSFETAANVLGIGSNNVIKIKADSQGRMIPEQLEQAINTSVKKGEKPFFVAATCGTTIMGSYDPIENISKICKKHQLWLHADGSFGGSIILSDNHRYLLAGIDKTDSFAWNPHKLMNIPLICSVLLIKQCGLLQKNITDINTDYIFHDTEEFDDLGKKSIQCGRSVDAVKLWFAWKYFGLDGYKNRIDNLIEIAKYAESCIISNPQFELIIPRQSFTLCFRYIPSIDMPMNRFNFLLRELLHKSGRTLVNYANIDDTLVIRLVTANGELEKSDIDLFFQNIEDGAKELEARNS